MEEEWMLPAGMPESLAAMSKGSVAPDVELVRQAATGDHAAFTTLFYQTYRYAFALVAALLTSDEDIHDALQEIYIRVYTGLPRLREPGAFLGWLKVIAQNCALSQRHKNQIDPLTNAVYAEGAEEIFLAEEQPREPLLDIRAVLESLPKEQARLLVLVYYDGLKLSEIARMQGEPASTVRSRFGAAKRALQNALKGRGIDRTVYGRGGFFSAVATSLRDAIGTDVLSAAVAQDILNGVLEDSKAAPIGYVAAKFSRRRRDAAVLRIAALVVALSLAASAVMVAVMTRRDTPATTPVVAGTAPTTTVTGRTEETTTTAETVFTTTSPAEEVVGPTAPPSLAETTPPTTTATTTDTGVTAVTTTAGTGTTVTTATATETGKSTTTTKSTVSTKPTTTTTTRPIFTVPADFVSDYREGYANTVGNDMTNLRWSGGTVARQDQWLYICARGEEPILFKQHLITGQRVILYRFTGPRKGRTLNVVGDWIYTVDEGEGIVRLRTDGSRVERLSTRTPYWMAVRGTEVFYSDNGRVYLLDMNTRQTTLTSMEDTPLVCADAVYVYSYAEAMVYLWTENGVTELASSVSQVLAVSDRAIYVRANTNEILSIDRAGQATEVYRPTNGPSSYLNFMECWEMDGYLVGIEDSGALRVIQLSTGQRINVSLMPNGFSNAHMLGNTLYWWQGETLYARQWQSITFGSAEIVYTSEK